MASVALVTGCSSGFGLLAAVELAKNGVPVVATVRDLGRRAALDRAALDAGVTLQVQGLDVTSAESIAGLRRVLDAQGDHVEILVNNAGYGIGGTLEDLTMDELRDQFETNFFGLVAVTKAFLPNMRARGKGRIVNVSSISARLAKPGLSAYSASKWAVEGVSEALRFEMAPHGVAVVLVEPGTYRTDIYGRNRKMAAAASDPASPNRAFTEHLERAVSRILEHADGDPADVARVIVHAAITPRPRLRYLVGRDTRLEVVAKTVLPWRWLESGVRFGLDRMGRR